MKNYLLKPFSSFRIVVTLVCLLLISPLQSLNADTIDQRNFYFLIDLSGSMEGAKISAAKESLSQIISSGQIQGQISIVGFSTTVKTILEPSYDRQKALEAISLLQTSGNTSLYDGIDSVLMNETDSRASTIIAITDGKDTSSKISLDNLADKLRTFDGEIHFIDLSQDLKLRSSLDYIVGDKGSVIGVAEISSLLETIKPLVVTEVSSLEIDRGIPVDSQSVYLNWVIVLSLSITFMLLFSYYLYSQRFKRLNRLKVLGSFDSQATQDESLQEKSLFFKALRVKPFHDYVKKEERRLLAAGLNLDIRTWIYLQTFIFIFLNLILLSSGFTPFLSLFVSGLFGFGIGYLYLSSIRSRKIKLFSDELPDTLAIISGSLKSGLSFFQAVESVAKQGDNEIALQFRRVLAEVQLGRPLNDALSDVAERMESTDFRWTISALSIQKEVGGNLSEILTSTAATIRGRAEIRREIRTLSAEGRMSAYILVAMPFFMMLYLQFTKPEYLKILFTTPIGILMLSIVVVLMIIGWIWVKKAIEVKLT